MARDDANDAFGFNGTWKDYLPIALTNLLLTIVTLGIYRFWAQARERRYLWSRTRFIDDTLEWTGTGREMFLGFLTVMLVIALPLLILQFGIQALILRGYEAAGVLGFLVLYLVLSWVGGIGRFRALRYRLSRTLWHGIRGGSDDKGYGFAVSAMWKPFVGALALGTMIPWSMTSLWNERWNKMSFGPHAFEAGAQWQNLIGRWILFLLSPWIALLLFFVLGGAALAGFQPGTAPSAGIVFTAIAFVLGFYMLIGIIGLGYYAAYFRECVGGLSLGELQFGFEARSKDWILLFLGDIAVVVLTLGIGVCMLGYRHWAFFIRHLEAYGEVDLATLTQSATRAPREAEGIADAFDIGAF